EGGGADASVRSVSRPRIVLPPRRRRRGPSPALAASAPCSPIPTPTEGPMTTTTAGAATHVRWWKEPTKDQWMAWWAAWLGLDARRVRLHRVPAHHGADRQGVRRSSD